MTNTERAPTPSAPARTVRTELVAVRDTQLYVEDAGAGPTLLFIHGMCGGAHVWHGQIQRLSDRFRCISYDRRGHTRSPRGEAAESVETHAEDAAVLIQTLDVRPVLVGSSGGARIGVELARRHPELLMGAVLSEPPIPSLISDAGATFLSDIAAVVRPAIAEGGPRAGVDAFFGYLCPGLWTRLAEAEKERYRANADMMLAELAGPAYQLDPADLPRIDVPALVMHGDLSHPAFAAIARVLANGMPRARLHAVEGSGHVVYVEQPDQFASTVQDFAAALSV
jgi:pimeloyl-ACP methyl ester carboxylesterase